MPPPPPPPGNSLNGVPTDTAAPATTRSCRPGDGAVPAAPSAFSGNGLGRPERRLQSRTTTRSTGEYLTPDGQLQQLQNLAAGRSAEVVEGPAPDLTLTAAGATPRTAVPS